MFSSRRDLQTVVELLADPGAGVHLGGALEGVTSSRTASAPTLSSSGGVELEREDAADAVDGAASCRQKKTLFGVKIMATRQSA